MNIYSSDVSEITLSSLSVMRPLSTFNGLGESFTSLDCGSNTVMAKVVPLSYVPIDTRKVILDAYTFIILSLSLSLPLVSFVNDIHFCLIKCENTKLESTDGLRQGADDRRFPVASCMSQSLPISQLPELFGIPN